MTIEESESLIPLHSLNLNPDIGWAEMDIGTLGK